MIELLLELCLRLINAEHPRCLEVHLFDLGLILRVLLDDLLDRCIQLFNDRGIRPFRCKNDIVGIDGEILIGLARRGDIREELRALREQCPEAAQLSALDILLRRTVGNGRRIDMPAKQRRQSI